MCRNGSLNFTRFVSSMCRLISTLQPLGVDIMNTEVCCFTSQIDDWLVRRFADDWQK